MKSYLITDPRFYSTTPTTFRMTMQKTLQKHQPDFALYRDKNNPDYAEMAKLFLELCSGSGKTKAILHGNVGLAAELHAYGVHLTSQQFDEIEAAKASGLFVVISCHSEAEILEAQRRGADAVTYSPIFNTPDKGEPKGLEDLNERVAKISLPIIALGGITTKAQVKAVEQSGCYGFASIRYFIDN
ncbi:thiamine phosphate synthase [Sulfurimonas sp. HSL3-7]|uniref:thiamine phosphate synthase n=1 Tax=Sulfonitrofixus jiaomeiensis TaxID=3131938 RepID=UPI0031F8D6E3